MTDRIDVEWALEKLQDYSELVNKGIDLYPETCGLYPSQQAVEELEVVKATMRRNRPQVNEILAAVESSQSGLPEVDGTLLRSHQHITETSIGMLVTAAETAEHLRLEPTIDIDPSDLHPWVWDPAKSLWRDGHHGQAIQAAATSVNLQSQAKTGRNDISNTDLMMQLLSPDQPTESSPVRLRVHPDDGSETYKSQQDGAKFFAAGVFMLLRNFQAHQLEGPAEEVAIESLAAISLLARILDEAVIEHLSDVP